MMVVAVGITSEELRTQDAPVSRRAVRVPDDLKCLIVSGDEGFRGRLEAVADLSGSTAFTAPADVAAMVAAVDGDYELVIVDLTSPLGERVTDMVEIAEEFAGRPGTLLVVCGSEDSVEEELWARQLGAWVYLPGVSSGDDLLSLFVESRRIFSRRGGCQLV